MGGEGIMPMQMFSYRNQNTGKMLGFSEFLSALVKQ
jgi:hypothetical protein